MAEETTDIVPDISVPSPAAEVELDQCEEVAEIENFDVAEMQPAVVILPTAEDENLMQVLYDREIEGNDTETVKGKRGRGRPRKYPQKIEPEIKRPRGRPRIHPIKEPGPVRKRGRPRIHPLKESKRTDGAGTARKRGRPRIYPKIKTPSDKHSSSESDSDSHSDYNSADYVVVEMDSSLGELSCEAPSPRKRGRPKKQLQKTPATIKQRGRPRKNEHTASSKNERKPVKASPRKGQRYEEVESHVKNSAYKRLWRSENRLAQKPTHSKNSSAAIDTLILKRVKGRQAKRKPGRPKRDPDDFSPMIKYKADGTPVRKKPLKPAPVLYNPDGSVKKRPRGRPKKEFVHSENQVKNENVSEPRKRGRPKKFATSKTGKSAAGDVTLVKNEVDKSNEDIPLEPKKPRGRPRKDPKEESAVKSASPVKRGRGRPKKMGSPTIVAYAVPAIDTSTDSKDILSSNIAECGDNIMSSSVAKPENDNGIATVKTEDAVVTEEGTTDAAVLTEEATSDAVVTEKGTTDAAVVTEEGTSDAAVVTEEGASDAAVGTEKGTSEAAVVIEKGTSDDAVVEEAPVSECVKNDSNTVNGCALVTAPEVLTTAT